ncbi:MAG: hypothetical protein JWR26_1722 [Pedosphaera sp.]|nr:hypothetical protein [Pedosphaera sp.]
MRLSKLSRVFFMAGTSCAIAAGLSGLGVSTVRGADQEQTLSPRELYNIGTRKLKDGKFHEAEIDLQGAVASQDAKVQAPALYNLGHTRYEEGKQELTNAPDARAVRSNSERSFEVGGSAIRAVDEALVSDDTEKMVAAYMQGRGARKDLKGAIEAVKKAMETYGAALEKWQRSSGDFKSTYELNPAEKDAKSNAAIMDRLIAALVDFKTMMMQMGPGLQKERDELRGKMGQLKKKLSENGKEPGGKGDDDDDEDDPPKDPKDGQPDEGPSKGGKEIQLTPEEAQRLLGMLKLDANRKLPLGGFEEGSKPKDRKGRDW